MVDAFKTCGSSPPKNPTDPNARDIIIEEHGSLVLLRPLNDGAENWLREHTAADAQWFGGALVVEPRYVADIVNGASNDGLVVRRGYSAILGSVTRPR